MKIHRVIDNEGRGSIAHIRTVVQRIIPLHDRKAVVRKSANMGEGMDDVIIDEMSEH